MMRVLDLFCGAAGGWSLGMHRAGYRTVAACEIDPWRLSVFAANNPGVLMLEDVRDVSARSLRAALGYLPEVIVGSPPCQDASVANHRGKGTGGARTGLFSEFVRLVREIRPLWFAAENVPGLRARGADWIFSSLAAAGYATWPIVVGADDIGAPHERKRVWIIGVPAIVAADAPLGTRAPLAPRPVEDGGARAAWGGLGLRGLCGAPADADGPGLAQRQGERGDPRQECPAAERGGGPDDAADADGPGREGRQRAVRRRQPLEGDREEAGVAAYEDPGQLGAILDRFGHWNGGFHGAPDGVDDGLSKGVARDCIAAYGDGVVPQITEAIGRVMAGLLAPSLDAMSSQAQRYPVQKKLRPGGGDLQAAADAPKCHFGGRFMKAIPTAEPPVRQDPSVDSGRSLSRRASAPAGPRTRSVPIERLREEFVYDPEIGRLRAAKTRVKGNRRKAVTRIAGEIASTRHRRGENQYRKVSIDRVSILEHVAIWAIVHGSWPSGRLDHANGNKSDNHLVNLRQTNDSGNRANAHYMRKSSLPRCVYQRNGKFIVLIKKDGASYRAGPFDELTKADTEARALHLHLFGEMSIFWVQRNG